MTLTPSNYRYILCDWLNYTGEYLDHEKPVIKTGKDNTKVLTVITNIKHLAGYWKPPKQLEIVETASAVCQR